MLAHRSPILPLSLFLSLPLSFLTPLLPLWLPHSGQLPPVSVQHLLMTTRKRQRHRQRLQPMPLGVHTFCCRTPHCVYVMRIVYTQRRTLVLHFAAGLEVIILIYRKSSLASESCSFIVSRNCAPFPLFPSSPPPLFIFPLPSILCSCLVQPFGQKLILFRALTAGCRFIQMSAVIKLHNMRVFSGFCSRLCSASFISLMCCRKFHNLNSQ